ncbi:MAG: hypothetical protein C0603_06720 [Denitrovibrio sp.]|nr:MAG: hypothetical protein C0603_06720 [Denitrovibrio sp.]
MNKNIYIENGMMTLPLPDEYQTYLDNPVHWIKDEQGRPIDFTPFNAVKFPLDSEKAMEIIGKSFYLMSCVQKQAFEELSQLEDVEIIPVTE